MSDENETNYPACELVFRALANQISFKKLFNCNKTGFEAKSKTPSL